MVPVGLLAIIAVGMVIAYVLPQRIKERGDYALVRTEDRYSAQMRVVKSSAERLEKAAARPSTDSGQVPLLATGATRASQVSASKDSARIASERAETFSRPAGPLDQAAVYAQRERLRVRRDRAEVLAERAAQARRRLVVAGGALVVAIVAWSLVGAVGASPVVGILSTGVFAGVVGAGARAAAAQRQADERIMLVSREVEAAATATQALRVVSRERAAGHEAAPSDVATQAIRVVTAEDLAPLSAPAQKREPRQKVESAPEAPAREESAAWSPSEMPAPSYTLKSTVRQREARPISTEDYDAALARARRWGESRETSRDASAPVASASSTSAAGVATGEAETTTAALDAILARRRRASA
ncbi:hypothetical protein [Demequina sediminicola]|uniref:hypothetical protein n=1 Tax=Demequina sediminicola TaxID=1095026 RepID=UPI000785D557|nr:hypothetical protein [Demequina sediminicola]